MNRKICKPALSLETLEAREVPTVGLSLGSFAAPTSSIGSSVLISTGPQQSPLVDRANLVDLGVNATFSNGLLRIDGTDRPDRIVLRQTQGRLSLDGLSIQSGANSVASVSTQAVRRIEVRGQGGEDLLALLVDSPASFRARVFVDGGQGRDVIVAPTTNTERVTDPRDVVFAAATFRSNPRFALDVLNQQLSSGVTRVDAHQLFTDGYMKGMIGRSFAGAGNQTLRELMHQMFSSPRTFTDGQLQDMARIRMRPIQDIRLEYQRFLAALDLRSRPVDTLSQSNRNHMGTTEQLRFGKVIGDALGIDPVFGAVLDPTGGITGPSNTNLNPMKSEILHYHTVFHDAAGFLKDWYNLGPGYIYVKNDQLVAWGIGALNPVAGLLYRAVTQMYTPSSGQVSGIVYWTYVLGAERHVDGFTKLLSDELRLSINTTANIVASATRNVTRTAQALHQNVTRDLGQIAGALANLRGATTVNQVAQALGSVSRDVGSIASALRNNVNSSLNTIAGALWSIHWTTTNQVAQGLGAVSQDVGAIALAFQQRVNSSMGTIAQALYSIPWMSANQVAQGLGAVSRDVSAITTAMRDRVTSSVNGLAGALRSIPWMTPNQIAQGLGTVTRDVGAIASAMRNNVTSSMNTLASALWSIPWTDHTHVAQGLGSVSRDAGAIASALRSTLRISPTRIAEVMYRHIGWTSYTDVANGLKAITNDARTIADALRNGAGAAASTVSSVINSVSSGLNHVTGVLRGISVGNWRWW